MNLTEKGKSKRQRKCSKRVNRRGKRTTRDIQREEKPWPETCLRQAGDLDRVSFRENLGVTLVETPTSRGGYGD